MDVLKAVSVHSFAVSCLLYCSFPQLCPKKIYGHYILLSYPHTIAKKGVLFTNTYYNTSSSYPLSIFPIPKRCSRIALVSRDSFCAVARTGRRHQVEPAQVLEGQRLPSCGAVHDGLVAECGGGDGGSWAVMDGVMGKPNGSVFLKEPYKDGDGK